MKNNGRYEDAINHFEIAIESNPENYGSHWRLAQTYCETGNFSLAIESYCNALLINTNPQIHEELNSVINDNYSELNISELIIKYIDQPGKLSSLSTIFENLNLSSESDLLKQSVSIHQSLSKSSKDLIIVFASRNENTNLICNSKISLYYILH